MLPKAAVVVLHSQSKTISCWKCSEQTAPQIFCERCHSILDYRADSILSHFDILGVTERLVLDENELRNKFYELSKQLHPDRFAVSPAPAPQFALRWTTALNRAYKTLKSKEDRTQYIIEKYLGHSSSAKKSTIPSDLAETYFEIQDLLTEGQSEPLLSFKKELEKKLAESDEQWIVLANTFDETENKLAATQALRDHQDRERYLKSMLNDLERKVSL